MCPASILMNWTAGVTVGRLARDVCSLNGIKPFTLNGGKGLGGAPCSYVAGYKILYLGDWQVANPKNVAQPLWVHVKSKRL
jgi:hypothetical protein